MQEQPIPLGLCQCGCGRKTALSTKTHARYGLVKGEPRRYVKGHQNREPGPNYEVDPATGCWQWLRTIKPDTGYGVIHIDARIFYAHRVYYERHVGPIPAGLQIDHLCRNRACVNPAHLEAVTVGENVLRGEGPSARAARMTHCKHGHPLSGDNLYTHKGKRGCRVCRSAASRASEARRAA